MLMKPTLQQQPLPTIFSETSLANRACAEIYNLWRRYLSHTDALEQAEQFAQRCGASL
jgi:hypothetical protein